MNRRLFSNKQNRDAAWKAGGKRGYRSSIRNQLMHPMYVEDARAELTAEDCGFGNTVYKTHFSTLYILESQ